jgi:Relaxase/Mobilisation nuclease domain
MIGKAKTNKSLSATINYNEKEKAELIYSNKMEGDNIKDFCSQMQDLQKCYSGYGKQLTIHAILSPSINDGLKLSETQWQTIAEKYLAKLKLIDYQTIGFLHTDKEHKHLHLVINKVSPKDFKLYHDGFIGKKSQLVADGIAKEMKLIRAMKIRQNKLTDEQRKSDFKQIIPLTISDNKALGSKETFKNLIEKVIEATFLDVKDYFSKLQKVGFIVHEYKNKETGELRGYGIEMNGTKMDASAVSKKYTLNSLGLVSKEPIIKNDEAKSILNNKEPNKINILTDNKKIANLIEFADSLNLKKELLQDKNIEMVEVGKRYYLGMKNDSNGYTMKNIFATDYFGENDVTTIIRNNTKPIIVVEDMVSYLEIIQKNRNTQSNFMILHSLLNKDKAINKLIELRSNKVVLSLKGDKIGNSFAKEILMAINNAVAFDQTRLNKNNLSNSLESKDKELQIKKNKWERGI